MIVRIYTGHDGQTHFEDLPLPAEQSHNIALQAGANLVFRCFPADYWSDWHTAPRRQYIFILAGQMEICLLYTSPSPRDRTRSRMPSSA